MKDLITCRNEIDAIDAKMRELFLQRMQIVTEVIAYKKAHHLEIYQPDREVQVIEKNASTIEDPLLKEAYIQFLKTCMELSKTYQNNL